MLCSAHHCSVREAFWFAFLCQHTAASATLLPQMQQCPQTEGSVYQSEDTSSLLQQQRSWREFPAALSARDNTTTPSPAGAGSKGLCSSPPHPQVQHPDQDKPSSSKFPPSTGQVAAQALGGLLGQQKLSFWDAEFAKPLGTCMLNSAPACGSGGMSRMWLRSLHLPRFGVFPSFGMVAKSKRKPQQGGVERLGRQLNRWATIPAARGAQFGPQSFGQVVAKTLHTALCERSCGSHG